MQLLLQALVGELADRSKESATGAEIDGEGDGATFLAVLDAADAADQAESDGAAVGEDGEVSGLPGSLSTANVVKTGAGESPPAKTHTSIDIVVSQPIDKSQQPSAEQLPSSDTGLQKMLLSVPEESTWNTGFPDKSLEPLNAPLPSSGVEVAKVSPDVVLPDDLPAVARNLPASSAQPSESANLAGEDVKVSHLGDTYLVRPIGEISGSFAHLSEKTEAHREKAAPDVTKTSANQSGTEQSRHSVALTQSMEVSSIDKRPDRSAPSVEALGRTADGVPAIHAAPNTRVSSEASRSVGTLAEDTVKSALPLDEARPAGELSTKVQIGERDREAPRDSQVEASARNGRDSEYRAASAQTTMSTAQAQQPTRVMETTTPLDFEAGPLKADADLVARETGEQLRTPASDRSRPEVQPPRMVVAQVVQSVTRSSVDNVVEVKLQPEELGRVRLTLSPSEAGVTVFITAERSETLEMLRRNIDMLAGELGERGFSNLSFSFSGDNFDRESREGAPEGAKSEAAPMRANRLEVELMAERPPVIAERLDIRV